MTTKKWILLTGATFFLVLGFLAFRPIPTPDENELLHAKGLVTEINESGTKDIFFKLQGFDRTFYANRGLEKGLDLKRLRAVFINKEILIKYPKYWTPLDPTNSQRHISKIEFNGQTIFTELNN
ncbi:hypothetical protein [Chitinophaga sp. S165]|uniref:hypothetical protein n=1 Tax=Chitinophaga sp. S165 TaxID=2135462 RepID=UPI000D70FEB2|nr:hypothetical protein [Chitinophaga sp. S165]PWV46451.1 hypothetical protein C7475_11011 [Chitinophaga sp. S165]